MSKKKKNKANNNKENYSARCNHHNENVLCSYYMHNLSKVTGAKVERFNRKESHRIIRALQKMNENGNTFSLDLLVSQIYTIDNHNFKYSELNDIYTLYTDFANIEENEKILYNDWVKSQLAEKITEDIWVKTQQADLIDFDELNDLADRIKEIVHATGEEKKLLTTEDLSIEHLSVLDDRASGKRNRSLGFNELDSKLTKPAAGGEITLAVAQKGSGKSIFVKNIENILINKNVPVLSFNPEMTSESSTDRLICIREDINILDLQNPYSNPRKKARIERAIERFSNLKSYLYCSDVLLSLDNIDSSIYKAKSHFKSLGFLADDEYMVVTIDLLSMVSDFGDLTPTEIEVAMNKLHIIARKHNIHVIGVIQANENKFRNGKMFKKSDELDYYKIGLEDIKGGSAFAERARVVLTLHRPLFMKRRFFPEMEDVWQLEEDIMWVNCIKQNDGDIFSLRMLFGSNFRIMPFADDNETIKSAA